MKQILMMQGMLLILFIQNVKGQDYQESWNNIKRDAETLKETSEFARSFYDNILRDFCIINVSMNTIGDSIVALLTDQNNVYENDYFLVFARNNAQCLSKKQRELVKKKLESIIMPFEVHFHKLVCEYKITSFNDIIAEFVHEGDLAKIQDRILSKKISHVDILKLRNYSTIASLGDKEVENQLIKFVNDLFRNASEVFEKDYYPLLIFYTKVIPNIFGFLDSKKSVVETLELFRCDLEISSEVGLSTPFDYLYYQAAILPKIDRNVWIYLRSDGIGEKKSEIIERILTDDSIWRIKN